MLKHTIPLVFIASLAQAQTKQPSCDPDDWAELLGQDQSVLEKQDLPERTRVIAPNDAVTADFIESRLNVILDEAGVIIGFGCF